MVKIDVSHENIILKDGEGVSSMLEMGQSEMCLCAVTDESQINEVVVWQTSEKNKNEMETSDGQIGGQTTNYNEVIATKLYQALSEAGKKS